MVHKNSAEINLQIHRLTQVILSIFWFSKFCLKSFQTMFVMLQETNAFHVWHPISLLVVYSVGQVDLVRQ